MKNTAIEAEASSAAWADALRLFDADLRRRGAAEKTRRAYGIDVGQLAGGAEQQGIAPDGVDLKVLRRWAVSLSGRGGDERPAATTVARKLAAIRAFFRVLREHGRVSQNPADLLPAPKKPSPLPRALKAS